MFQCFLNREYSIFAPNFRGSTGYGASFVKLVERVWGERPSSIAWPELNGCSSKASATGINYSWWAVAMALLLHGRHPEYFKAVVDIFGVSDLFTFYNSVPEHWKPMMELWIGNPERDKERFTKDMPTTYLDGMVKSMLVIQDVKDPRVVKKRVRPNYCQVARNWRDVEYLVLDDEGHGFSRKENEIAVYSMMLEFLAKHQR